MSGRSRVEKAFLPLLLLYLLLGCARQASGPPLHGGRIEPARAAANFALTDQDGKPFALDSTRGKVVLLYFGYSSCPDVCPTTLSDMAAAREQLGADANQVQVVFVTVDPERDTQEVLKRYVPAFDASFTGLRGSADTIKQVADAYGVKYKKTPLANSALGYAVDHSAFVYVIDRTGRLRELFPFGTSREDITSDLRVLLTEGAY